MSPSDAGTGGFMEQVAYDRQSEKYQVMLSVCFLLYSLSLPPLSLPLSLSPSLSPPLSPPLSLPPLSLSLSSPLSLSLPPLSLSPLPLSLPLSLSPPLSLSLFPLLSLSLSLSDRVRGMDYEAFLTYVCMFKN